MIPRLKACRLTCGCRCWLFAYCWLACSPPPPSSKHPIVTGVFDVYSTPPHPSIHAEKAYMVLVLNASQLVATQKGLRGPLVMRMVMSYPAYSTKFGYKCNWAMGYWVMLSATGFSCLFFRPEVENIHIAIADYQSFHYTQSYLVMCVE